MARHQLTARSLAGVLRLSVWSASRRLRGTQAFTLDELTAVAKWLDVPVAELLDDTP